MTLTLVDQREEAKKTEERRRSRGEQPKVEGGIGGCWGGGEAVGCHFRAIQKLKFDQNRNGIGQEQTVLRGGSILTHHQMGQFQQIFVGPHVPGGLVGPPPTQLKTPTQQNFAYQKLHQGYVSQSPNLPVPSCYLPYLPQPLFKAKHVPSMYGQQGHHSWSQPTNCEGVVGHERNSLRQRPSYPPPYQPARPHQGGHVAQGGQSAQAAPDSQYS